ncbi:hypothetical protein [Burkholderia multivorans]|uniref:hypothetical protein n=1 Tax=Burkholderia multivorans TaxID=87883 RepID=UPI003211E949
MKKLLNRPDAYADEALARAVRGASGQSIVNWAETGRVIARAGGMREGKVGIVSGGGSGHMPTLYGATWAKACSMPARSATCSRGPSVLDCNGKR